MRKPTEASYCLEYFPNRSVGHPLELHRKSFPGQIGLGNAGLSQGKQISYQKNP